VRIISRRRLREFWEEHADAEGQVRDDFGTASFLGGSRTVFNIGGNKYRLVVDMRYDLGRIYIREVLTHDDYDRRTREGTL
jgi:mRNA interferase HigB